MTNPAGNHQMMRVTAQRIARIGIVLTASVIFVNGQADPEPTPTPVPGRRETGIEATRRLDRAHDRIAAETYSNLYGQGAYANSPRFNRKWRAAVVDLYRKPRNSETEILEPDERHRRLYEEFLRSENTGIFKLIPNLGCKQDVLVVDVSPDCLKYGFPGSGSSYSFRLKTYRLRRLADITHVKNSLIARGVFSGAIFVELGDIPIENVSLKTRGVGFLSNYKPVKTSNEALEEAKRFAKGVEKDGFVYGRGVYVTEANTFAMRSIAYRGRFMRSEAGVTYNELDFDKRRDIIVAFRIIGVEDDGSATIVFKVLRESKSPKLKIDQNNNKNGGGAN